jgi:hypothetical protein
MLVAGAEVDVEGDEEGAGADGCGAGRWMDPGVAEIGLSRCIGCDLVAQTLELPSANVGQVHPIGRVAARS